MSVLRVLPDLEQGSPEWLDQRRGMVTASVVGQLITVSPPEASTVTCPNCDAPPFESCVSRARKAPTPIKTAHAERVARATSEPPVISVANNDTARNLTTLLVAERVAGWTEDTPMTSDMWRGVEAEPVARNIYAEHYGPVTEVGFMVRDFGGYQLGYSPDGLVGDDGLIEVKAPRAKTHLRTVLADEVPGHYMAQCQAGLLVSGRAWLDFIPYVGGLPLWRKRVYPDARWFAAIEAACRQFETTAAEMVAAYERATEGLPATERMLGYGEIEAA